MAQSTCKESQPPGRTLGGMENGKNNYKNWNILFSKPNEHNYNRNRFSIRFSNRTRNNKKEVTRGLKIPVQTIPHAQPMQNQINQ